MLIHLKELITNPDVTATTAIFRLGVSFLFGLLIGAERQARRRNAGIRTFVLICMGSTMAMLISIWVPQSHPHLLNGDPGRIAAQVLSGIGFLGAGAIIQSRGSIQGLTTAACIWVVSVIGLAIGTGMFREAAVVTLLVLFVLITLEQLEKHMLLRGVNKLLSITCATDLPDIHAIHKILDTQKAFVELVSEDYDFTHHTAALAFKVNITAATDEQKVFALLRELAYITEIRITK